MHDVARLLAVALGGEGLDTAVVREAYERAEDRVSRGDRESLDVIATAAIATVRSLCDDVEALLEENARLSTLLRQANNED